VDRRRLSTYSLVLREAIKQKVLATQLAEWIEQNGGIQEIRLSQSANGSMREVMSRVKRLARRKQSASTP
jgi:hypothetical protein